MAWKQAKVIMLPKPGKDLTKPTSYRPISLLPAVGKVFERINASRLSTFLEKANYFDENQAGFRKNRSTLDQLFKLLITVEILKSFTVKYKNWFKNVNYFPQQRKTTKVLFFLLYFGTYA